MPTAPLTWQPDLVNPLMGEIQWPVPDNHTISVTLFKDPRTHELEDKDWTFVVEDVSGKPFIPRRRSLSLDWPGPSYVGGRITVTRCAAARHCSPPPLHIQGDAKLKCERRDDKQFAISRLGAAFDGSAAADL